jgi:hypothetical protein
MNKETKMVIAAINEKLNKEKADADKAIAAQILEKDKAWWIGARTTLSMMSIFVQELEEALKGQDK